MLQSSSPNETQLASSSAPKKLGIIARIRKFFRWLFIFLFLVAIPVVYQRWTIINKFYLEKDPPSIEVVNQPSALGLEPRNLVFKVGDVAGGVDEVVVRIHQKELKKEIFKEHFGGKPLDFIMAKGPLDRVHEKEITVALNAKELGLKPGKFDLSISVFDRAVWSNSANFSGSIEVDYNKPKIIPVTPQQNAILGGAELVFYRIRGKKGGFKGTHGVRMGALEFPGVQAKLIDAHFESAPELYAALFPVPLWMNLDSDSLELFARDEVGNLATAKFYYHIQHKTYGTRKLKANPELAANNFAVLSKILPSEAQSTAANLTDLQKLKLLNEDARRETEKKLQAVVRGAGAKLTKRLWKGPFLRSNAKEVSSFGEELSYLDSTTELSHNRQWGNDFLGKVGIPIQAAEDGVVLFAGELGIYGKTVIIDHGLGLTSVYANLGEVTLNVGDVVANGALLGRSGQSGFAELGLMHFEVRLHGIPVRAIEWWDRTWLDQHIERKIHNVISTQGAQP